MPRFCARRIRKRSEELPREKMPDRGENQKQLASRHTVASDAPRSAKACAVAPHGALPLRRTTPEARTQRRNRRHPEDIANFPGKQPQEEDGAQRPDNRAGRVHGLAQTKRRPTMSGVYRNRRSGHHEERREILWRRGRRSESRKPAATIASAPAKASPTVGQRVTRGRQRLAPARSVRKPAREQAGEAGNRFRRALNQTKGHGRRAQHRHQELRQQPIAHLGGGVVEERHPGERPHVPRQASFRLGGVSGDAAVVDFPWPSRSPPKANPGSKECLRAGIVKF